MKGKRTRGEKKWVPQLFLVGEIAVAVGACSWMATKGAGGWALAAGGFVMAVSYIWASVGGRAELSLRLRRLERMGLLASLIYLVSGGFMLQRSGTWLPLFIVATVLLLYALFVSDHVRKKEAEERDKEDKGGGGRL